MSVTPSPPPSSCSTSSTNDCVASSKVGEEKASPAPTLAPEWIAKREEFEKERQTLLAQSVPKVSLSDSDDVKSAVAAFVKAGKSPSDASSFESDEVMFLVGQLIEESALAVKDLAAYILSTLFPELSNSDESSVSATLATRAVIAKVATRRGYGMPNKPKGSWNDNTSACFKWSWEMTKPYLDRLPKSMADTIRSRRTRRKHIANRIKAYTGALKVLAAVPFSEDRLFSEIDKINKAVAASDAFEQKEQEREQKEQQRKTKEEERAEQKRQKEEEKKRREEEKLRKEEERKQEKLRKEEERKLQKQKKDEEKKRLKEERRQQAEEEKKAEREKKKEQQLSDASLSKKSPMKPKVSQKQTVFFQSFFKKTESKKSAPATSRPVKSSTWYHRWEIPCNAQLSPAFLARRNAAKSSLEDAMSDDDDDEDVAMETLGSFADAEKCFREFCASARRRRRLRLTSRAAERSKDIEIISKEQFSPSKGAPTPPTPTSSDAAAAGHVPSAVSTSSSSSSSCGASPLPPATATGANCSSGSGVDVAKRGAKPRLRMKLLKFFENRRPAYYGTFRKKAVRVNGRRVFVKEPPERGIDYDHDSDDDWSDEPQDGEELDDSDDDDDEEDSGGNLRRDGLEKDDFLAEESDEDLGEGDEIDDIAEFYCVSDPALFDNPTPGSASAVNILKQFAVEVMTDTPINVPPLPVRKERKKRKAAAQAEQKSAADNKGLGDPSSSSAAIGAAQVPPPSGGPKKKKLRVIQPTVVQGLRHQEKLQQEKERDLDFVLVPAELESQVHVAKVPSTDRPDPFTFRSANTDVHSVPRAQHLSPSSPPPLPAAATPTLQASTNSSKKKSSKKRVIAPTRVIQPTKVPTEHAAPLSSLSALGSALPPPHRGAVTKAADAASAAAGSSIPKTPANTPIKGVESVSRTAALSLSAVKKALKRKAPPNGDAASASESRPHRSSKKAKIIEAGDVTFVHMGSSSSSAASAKCMPAEAEVSADVPLISLARKKKLKRKQSTSSSGTGTSTSGDSPHGAANARLSAAESKSETKENRPLLTTSLTMTRGHSSSCSSSSSTLDKQVLGPSSSKQKPNVEVGVGKASPPAKPVAAKKALHSHQKRKVTPKKLSAGPVKAPADLFSTPNSKKGPVPLEESGAKMASASKSASKKRRTVQPTLFQHFSRKKTDMKSP